MKQKITENLLSSLKSKTENEQQRWVPTSLKSMFGTSTTINGDYVFLTVEKKMSEDVLYDVCLYDNLGEVLDKKSIIPNDTVSCCVEELYNSVIDSSEELGMRYQEAERIMNEEKEQRELHTITMEKLSKRLLGESMAEKTNVKVNSYFRYEDEQDNKFEMPPLLQIPTTEDYIPLSEAEVMIIAAPGATGKTILSKYLSQYCQFLRLDLGVFGPVGSNSLLGVFAENFENPYDLVNMTLNLKHGKTTMIIDGLDEASLKATESGYEGFLDDVVKLAKGANGLAFVMLGRTKVVEDTCVYLENAQIKVILTQIEPFTINGAKSFVDKQQDGDNQKQYKQYCEARDYIIYSIQGFFKDESAINNQLYERFIGYAPVLLAISKLLKENSNYHDLLHSLKEDQKNNVELVVNIVERIMNREQDKIRSLVTTELLHDRDKGFCEDILSKMYGIKEQCSRLLAFVQNEKYFYNISDDEGFNHLYNDCIGEWLEDHPLLDKARTSFQNIVFESYVLASLMHNTEIVDEVCSYLKQGRGAGYMLFEIYRYLNKSETVDYHYVGSLYESFTALDKVGSSYVKEAVNGEMQLLATDSEKPGGVTCMVTFSHGESSDIIFKTYIPFGETIVMPSYLCNVLIDAPISIEFTGNKVEIASPVHIMCKSIAMQAREVIFTSIWNEKFLDIDFSCEDFKGILDDGNVPKLTIRTPNANNSFVSIFCKNKLSHPFADYKHEYYAPMKHNSQLLDKYQKLRRLLLLFRANGKDGLARVKSKIENRITNVPIGRKVLNALLREGVIYEKDAFYFIDTKRMDEVLETSYADIQKFVITAQTSLFLNKIS